MPYTYVRNSTLIECLKSEDLENNVNTLVDSADAFILIATK